MEIDTYYTHPEVRFKNSPKIPRNPKFNWIKNLRVKVHNFLFIGLNTCPAQ